MKKRRKSRELAIQILYSYHKNEKTIDETFKDPIFSNTQPECREYALTLVNGVKTHKTQLDEIISGLSKNWKIERIALIDIIILRIALFEIIHLNKEVPAVVAINEAIELAKKFSTRDSGKFINGILDKYYKSSCKQE